MISAGLANALRIGITGACFVLALYGFMQAYPAHNPRDLKDYVEILYKAIQLVLGQFPSDLAGHSIPLSLQISRFALPIAAAWATISIGWEQVRNRVRGWMIRRKGDHLIVAGEGALAEGLVRGELKRKRAVLAWVTDDRGRIAREAEDHGGAYVEGAPGMADLSKLGIETARGFVAASESDATNMEMAKRVLDHAAKRRAGDPLQIVARIDDVALQDALEARLSRREQRGKVELRLASAPQLLARQFLLTNPIDRLVSKPGEPVRLCFIGWSPLAEMMMVRVLASSHFNHEARIELLVADHDAARAAIAFRSRRPFADQIALIEFEPLQNNAPSLVAQWLLDQQGRRPLNAVCVTLDDTSDALATAMAIETGFERAALMAPPLYVHVPNSDSEAGSLVDDSLMQPFGAVKSLADPEALLQERHDEIARSIHEFYLEGRLADGAALGDRPTLAEWIDLPEAVRDENRLVADCYYFKLRGIGASILEGEGPSIRFSTEEVEYLAEAEHRRWMAAKLLAGWAYGEVRDDDAKRHPDLVPYSALSKAIKDLDREQIRMIPRILNLVQRRAVRNLVVAIRCSQTGPLDSAAVQAALDQTASAFPDRRIIVRGEIDDPRDLALLLQAEALGFPLDLVLRRPATAVLRETPAVDRARIAQMIRDAYALHACPDPADAPPVPDLTIDLNRPVVSAAPELSTSGSSG